MAMLHRIIQKNFWKALKTPILLSSMALLALLVVLIWSLCATQSKNSSQEILEKERHIQESKLEVMLDAAHDWRDKLTERLLLVSTAEMIRLFATDALSMGPDIDRLLSLPAEAYQDDALASLADQALYIQAILRDLAQRHGWLNTRILGPQGQNLVAADDSISLDQPQMELGRQAAAIKSTVFGPIRSRKGVLVMDVAEPLLPVMGTEQQNAVGALLTTIPMQQILHDILHVGSCDEQVYLLDLSGKGPSLIIPYEEKADLLPLSGDPAQQSRLGFSRRPDPQKPGQDIYAMGGKLGHPHWHLMLAVPAASVDALLQEERFKIYGLGSLGSAAIVLIYALVLAYLVSRSHKATAQHFQGLYTLIRQQKSMLDSINASLQAGLLLTDKRGNVLVCNPAFCRMTGKEEAALIDRQLHEFLPPAAAASLREAMHWPDGNDTMQSIEISIPTPETDDTRLYRVSLFPYEENTETGETILGGSVGIFQDITEFRRKAEAARERQSKLMLALVRAIESVDSNLLGHSHKMERVIGLLTKTMKLSEKDVETLLLAARLSQVGKIFVPHHLLSKKGKLNREEQAEVDRAPEYAYNVLRDLQFGLPVPEAVYQMGERMDGTGKPQRLRAEEIGQHAKILAVVNAFCSMVSSRSYRKAMTRDEALALLAQDSGFDQSIVAALAQIEPAALRALYD